jgi:hypothetical protein
MGSIKLRAFDIHEQYLSARPFDPSGFKVTEDNHFQSVESLSAKRRLHTLYLILILLIMELGGHYDVRRIASCVIAAYRREGQKP